MSDVDYQGGKYLLLNRVRIQRFQLGFFVLALLFFTVYALLLREMCSYTDAAISSLLLLSLQVVVGITATRISQTLGQRSGDYLSNIDPSRLNFRWESVEVEVPLGAVSQLFEKFKNMVGSDEEVADDSKLGKIGTLSELEDDEDDASGSGSFLWSF